MPSDRLAVQANALVMNQRLHLGALRREEAGEGLRPLRCRQQAEVIEARAQRRLVDRLGRRRSDPGDYRRGRAGRGEQAE